MTSFIQISKTQKEWREFKPSSEELSLSDNSSFVRCKATNSQGVIFSDAAKLKVRFLFLKFFFSTRKNLGV